MPAHPYPTTVLGQVGSSLTLTTFNYVTVDFTPLRTRVIAYAYIPLSASYAEPQIAAVYAVANPGSTVSFRYIVPLSTAQTGWLLHCHAAFEVK